MSNFLSVLRPPDHDAADVAREDARKDIQAQENRPAPEQQQQKRIENQQSFICQIAALAQIQFIDMLLAPSDKVFDIIGDGQVRQVGFEIPIDSIGGNMPVFCGSAEYFISAEAGDVGYFLQIIFD